MKALARAVAAVSVLVLWGCGNGVAAPTNAARDAAVYEAALREVALPAVETDADSEDLPRLYVVAAPEGIPAEVQVNVVKALIDDADLVFTDDRDDALVLDEIDEPVRDDTLLVTLGPVEGGERRVELDLSLYRSKVDHQLMTVALELSSDDTTWTVSDVADVS